MPALGFRVLQMLGALIRRPQPRTVPAAGHAAATLVTRKRGRQRVLIGMNAHPWLTTAVQKRLVPTLWVRFTAIARPSDTVVMA